MAKRGSVVKEHNLANISTTLNAKDDCIGIFNDVVVCINKPAKGAATSAGKSSDTKEVQERYVRFLLM